MWKHVVCEIVNNVEAYATKYACGTVYVIHIMCERNPRSILINRVEDKTTMQHEKPQAKNAIYKIKIHVPYEYRVQ